MTMRPSIPCFYLVGLMLLLSSLEDTFVGFASAHEETALSITFLGDVRLDDLGPEEPSGVAWGYSQQGKPRLWVVSDDTPMLYILKKSFVKRTFPH